MTSKILYFTAGQYPTAEELADIQKLNDAAEQPYSVNVMNAAADVKYGPLLKDCDYVAGSVPEPYSAITTIDPDNLPVQGLKATQAIINNSDSLSIFPATGTTPIQGAAVANVAGGVLSALRLAATSAIVNSGQTYNVTGGTVTLTVAANAVTATFTATP